MSFPHQGTTLVSNMVQDSDYFFVDPAPAGGAAPGEHWVVVWVCECCV